jgi:hypothetical protein
LAPENEGQRTALTTYIAMLCGVINHPHSLSIAPGSVHQLLSQHGHSWYKMASESAYNRVRAAAAIEEFRKLSLRDMGDEASPTSVAVSPIEEQSVDMPPGLRSSSEWYITPSTADWVVQDLRSEGYIVEVDHINGRAAAEALLLIEPHDPLRRRLVLERLYLRARLEYRARQLGLE